jgi:3'-phosphoadenosine 5'-phosphosulfate sulfotransferase (PAPS reductase)/FAD synthetase
MHPKKIVSFSGGQTSGYMLRKLIDSNAQFDKEFGVIFENTGKEHDATLDFVHTVETKWGVPVIWLEYTRVPAASILPELVPEGIKRKNLLRAAGRGDDAHWYQVVNYETAARDNQANGPFDKLLNWANVLPNVRTRMCSVQLKIRTRDRYLRAKGVGEFEAFIGIRKDEDHRKVEILGNIDQYETPRFPLCEDGTTKQDVDKWWNAHPFKLNIANFEGNCRMCFLKARHKRIQVATQDPKSAQWWADKEAEFKKKTNGDGAFFRRGDPYARIIYAAEHPQYDLYETFETEDIACSCAVGGYRKKGESDED